MYQRTMLRAPLACALVLALASSAALMGCSNSANGPAKAGEGQSGLAVSALMPSDVASATATVVDSKGNTVATTALTKQTGSNNWTALLSGIAAATYTVNVVAQDSTGATIYTGSVSSVSVQANQQAEVVIVAQQTAAASQTAAVAPVINSILAVPASTAPGGQITLTVNAQPGKQGDSLTYTWSSSNGGTFTQQSHDGSVATWTAPSTTGSYVLTVTVSEGRSTVQSQVTVSVSTGTTGSIDINATVNTWPVVTSMVGTPNYVVPAAATMLTVIANDADRDPMTYAWTSTCDAAGVWTNQQTLTPTFTLNTGATNTSCVFTVNVADNRGGTGSGTLTLPVGKPTVAVAPSILRTVQSSQTVGSASDTVTFSVNATDPQSLPLTYSWVADGGSSFTTATNTNQVTWAPSASATNSWHITATATDSANASVSKTFTIVPTSCFGVTPTASSAWTFGVMADTQWTVTDDGYNPNSVATAIIQQLNSVFVAKGVKFVVAVGDITDNGSNAALDTRVEFAQALYNAGIGFFPLRGNHEPTATAATEFKRIFPQTMGGMQNNTPTNAIIANADDVNTLPVAVSGAPFAVGSNFSAPSSVLTGTGNRAWDGLTYSFDYNNARFVLLDQFMKADGTSASGNYQITPQEPWISSVLAAKPNTSHGFVFGHKGFITENHTDTLFGADPSQDPTGQDTLITSMANANVRLYMGGHDHMHNRAIVTTTDGVTAKVQDIICASDSSKFYIPLSPATATNDGQYDVAAFGHTRETPIMQELNTIGYYVVTVDGTKATVDFYSADANPYLSSGEYLINTTPQLNFTKRETFGYGLNGKEFVVRQGQSYTSVQDTSPLAGATAFAVLSGTNANTNLEGGSRNPVKTVDTGWTAGTCATSSDVLSLWSTVSNLGSDMTDIVVLSMSYNPTGLTGIAGTPGFGLAVKDASGNWVNAVNKNVGGTKQFVNGAWSSSAGLGSYGIDTVNHVVWAVVNYGTGDFAAATISLN